MIHCIRRLEWDAAHRVPLHESKCRALHGHRYVAELYCEAPALDELGRVIDFGVVKDIVGTWIDSNWDHTCILMHPDNDPEVQSAGGVGLAVDMVKAISAFNGLVAGRPVYWMTVHPTAENIAAHLGDMANELFEQAGSAVRCVKIRLWETPNGSVEWSADK